MNVTCSDRERILGDGTPAEWAALEEHAVSCPLCAEEIRGWKSLSVAAQELRDYSDSPSFWPRIERALTEEAAGRAQHAESQGWVWFLTNFSRARPTGFAGATVMVL